MTWVGNWFKTIDYSVKHKTKHKPTNVLRFENKQDTEDAKKYREMMKKKNVKKACKGGVINRAKGGGVY